METDLETDVEAEGCWIQRPSCIGRDGGWSSGACLEEEEEEVTGGLLEEGTEWSIWA